MNQSRNQIPASFWDPSGFLFQENGHLLRQVNLSDKSDYDLLINSGLYLKLVEKKMLVPHEEVNATPARPEIAYKIIEPEKIGFITYPYEWSFSQLKDAALVTLRIQKEALNASLSLKDASAYNIQFHKGHPILIDTLSFVEYKEGEPWIAYQQFCMHFLAPLALMAHLDIQLGKLSQLYIDGIPLELASKLLPWKTRLNFGILTHIHLHAYSQKQYSNKKSTDIQTKTKSRMNKFGMIGLIESLESTVKELTWKPKSTRWVDY